MTGSENSNLQDFTDIVHGEDYHFSNSNKLNFSIDEKSKISALLKLEYKFLNKLSDSQLITISGAASGFLAGIIVCPFDVIKTRAQGTVSGNLVDIIEGIFRNEGLRGFYRGLVPITIGYLPTWTIYFTVYEKAKNFYPNYVNTTTSHVLSALTAGLASSIAVNPIWVVKTRLMVQTNEKIHQKTYYKGTINAFKVMYREEGLKVFYLGLLPSIIGLIHVGIHFPVYEKLKEVFIGDETNVQKDSNYIWNLILASSISKMIASSITYPHEILRTRSQIQEKSKSSFTDLIKEIWHQKGMRGFYSGYTINLVRTVPASAVTLVSFEYFKTYLLEMKRKSA